jgi:hypothetical protein
MSSSKESDSYNLKREVIDIFKLASGMFASRVAWTAMKASDTALILHTKVGFPQGKDAI